MKSLPFLAVDDFAGRRNLWMHATTWRSFGCLWSSLWWSGRCDYNVLIHRECCNNNVRYDTVRWNNQSINQYRIDSCSVSRESEARFKKLKIGHLYSVFSWELPFKALRMVRVNEGSHSFLCYPHVYTQMEWAILPLLPSRSASPHFGRYSFPVSQRVGVWVSLGGWLHTELPARRRSPIPVPTDR